MGYGSALSEIGYQENKNLNIHIFRESSTFPFNLHGFCWCTLAIRIPFYSNLDNMKWDSNKIKILKNAIENHEIGSYPGMCGLKPWTYKYNPFYKMIIQNIIEPNILVRYSKDAVNFMPMNNNIHRTNHIIDPENDKAWFNLHFDNSGLMVSTIGFPWKEKLCIESVINAFYVSLDLFNHNSIKECYKEGCWDVKQYKIYYSIDQFPGDLKLIYLKGTKLDPFPVKGSSFGGPHLAEIIDNIEPVKTTIKLANDFLSSVGYWEYEDSLILYLSQIKANINNMF